MFEIIGTPLYSIAISCPGNTQFTYWHLEKIAFDSHILMRIRLPLFEDKYCYFLSYTLISSEILS